MEEITLTHEMLADQDLKEHKIQSLFSNMLASLEFFRQENLKKFMVEYLIENNTESLFNIMKPTQKGFVTQKEYGEAMKTLDIKDYPKNPSDYEINQITFPTFSSIATTVFHKE
uniref:EFCAB10 C-terminal EF-hand domain-containing protein n=1 Tax=Octopus bimaculoides TaxID=37653 RepID=A0A0L8I279_OCTBM